MELRWGEDGQTNTGVTWNDQSTHFEGSTQWLVERTGGADLVFSKQWSGNSRLALAFTSKQQRVMGGVETGWNTDWNSLKHRLKQVETQVETDWNTDWNRLKHRLKQVETQVETDWNTYWNRLKQIKTGWNRLKQVETQIETGWNTDWNRLKHRLKQVETQIKTGWNTD